MLEGEIRHNDTALEGPFGDHTGYYNSPEGSCISPEGHNPQERPDIHDDHHWKAAQGGRSNRHGAEQAFPAVPEAPVPEIADFHLPMEAVSYRIAVVAIKTIPGHARRIMMGIWGF